MNRDIDFTPKGEIKANPIRIAGLYITGVLWAAAGVVLYFTVLREIWLILMCAGGGAVFLLIAFLMSKIVYYWDDTHFAIVQPALKNKVYTFDDMEHIQIDPQGAVLIIMKNKERYIMESTCIGLEEFKGKVREDASNGIHQKV